MTAPATYTYIVTDNAQQDAKAAHAARYTHDDWRINAEGTVFQAKVRGQVVWATRLTREATPVLYVTHQQASMLGLCYCGKPATVVGTSGLRCNKHQRGGESLLCSTVGCVQVSHTGFSSLCNGCITPEQRAAYDRYQAEQRAMWANVPYGSAPAPRIGWQRVTGR